MTRGSTTVRHVTFTLVVLLLSWLASPAAADALPAPPPLPPQPAAGGASSCRTQGGTPGTWSVLHAEAAPDHFPQFAITVDPWMPCRMYRARDRHSVDRSVDWGQTWATVFGDDSAAAAGSAMGTTCGVMPIALPSCADGSGVFSISGITVPAPGAVLLSEDGNGDAVVVSTDAGTTWHLHNRGIAGAAVQTLVTAPSDAATIYAVTRTDRGGGPTVGLYVTTDAGATWSAATLPLAAPAVVRSLQVDPVDPARLWLGIDLHAGWMVLESRDHAATWSVAASAQGTTLVQLLVTASPLRPLRWFVVAEAPNGVSVQMSDDDGATFRQAAVPRPGGRHFPGLAADSAAPGRMLYINGDLFYTAVATAVPPPVPPVVTADTLPDIFSSVDGFFSSRAENPPFAMQGSGASPFDDSTGSAVDPYDTTVMPVATETGVQATITGSYLQADRLGDFFVSVDTTCRNAGAAVGPQCVGRTGFVHALLRYRPAEAAPGAATAPGGGSAAAAGVLASLPSCAIPVPTTDPIRGTLAFDGRDLLYSLVETGPAPYTAVIHRMDPLTCRDTGDITVRFHPGDLTFVGGGARPTVGPMVYDPSRDALWATYGGDPKPSGEMTNGSSYFYDYLFIVPLDDLHSRHAVVDARLAPFHNGCGALLAYDYSDDTLWTCDVSRGFGGGIPLAHLRASDGAPLPSCVGDLDPNGDWATWAAGRPGRLYVQSEDDTTVVALDDRTCATDATEVHRPFSEPIDEDEQQICDPVTFGTGNALPGVGPVSVLWLRDASAQLVTPYVLPGEYCPLPTATRYQAARPVAPGQPVTLCASLHTVGLALPLSGRRLQFTVDGADAGYAAVDAAGRSCVTATAPALAGSHAVTVRFDGDASYLASGDVGGLQVTAAPAPGVALPPQRPVLPRAGLLPPPGPAEPPSGVEPVQPSVDTGLAQTVAQAQGQTQAQAQGQVNSQAVVMPQRQRQHQVAVQTGVASPVLQASAVRVRTALTVVTVQVALLTSLAWGRGSRRMALAEVVTRRRRRRRPTRFRWS